MARPRDLLPAASRLAQLFAILGVAMMLGLGANSVSAKNLKPGDPAPDFSLPGSDGRTHTLAEHRNKRVVVIAWFPKAFTGG